MNTFNPIKFANDVNTKFINYQLTAFPIADPDLSGQARKLLRSGIDYEPLIKGPFVSISKSFRWGRKLSELANAKVIHSALPGIAEYDTMFMHQDKALEEILKENHCLISTGTGSGKTEAFLYPIINHCLKLRDEGVPEGIAAILVYPMNALAIDQLNRLRKMLVGSGITFGLYVGTTAASGMQIANIKRMKKGEGRKEYLDLVSKLKEEDKNRLLISPPEERLTEDEISKTPPRILLTNVKQLELLMTRKKDVKIFLDSPLKYLVFDEAHTYSGVAGSEVSCLIRRIKSLCNKNADEVVCIGTSATIVDPELGDEAGKQFLNRFFGIDSNKISLVQEEYEEEEFPHNRYTPTQPNNDVTKLLDDILNALELEDEQKLRDYYRQLTGRNLESKNDLFTDLYCDLKENDYIYHIFHELAKPGNLSSSLKAILALLKRSDRSSSDQNKGELLCYLALGAAARIGENPLLRPKLHYFVKGIDGAVVSFDRVNNDFRTTLHLSKKSAAENHNEKTLLPVYVCKSCGQHYFEVFFNNCYFNGNDIEGAMAEGTNSIWQVGDESIAKRVILTDRFVSEIDTDDESIGERLDDYRAEIYYCKECGTLQKYKEDECSNKKCKRKNSLVKLFIVKNQPTGELSTCPTCKARSSTFSKYGEPIRPLRAVTVADVDILSQNMINAVDSKSQKLIVFADNRQDAAFQAGWMQDHARRYRFRHLVYEYLKLQTKPVSIGDIQSYLFKKLHDDESLGTALAPEVYQYFSDESYGQNFPQQLNYYLKIQLLREISAGFKMRDSLESWGMLKFEYHGLTKDSEKIKQWASELDLSEEDLVNGIGCILDSFRKNKYLYDGQAPIYSKFWSEGDFEIQNGYFPLMTGPNNKPVPPKGMDEKSDGTESRYKVYFRSSRGQSGIENYVKKWIKDDIKRKAFLDQLWHYFTTNIHSLTLVQLIGRQGGSVRESVYQLDSAKIGLSAHSILYKCNLCNRVHNRPSPKDACSSSHCKGKVIGENPSPDNYNVNLLQTEFSMVRAQEHSAQVPAKKREEIEDEFKNTKGKYNVLVATPTLELGVDIGSLDMVLMRNVPPTSSNYWQRAGRAGRRHRLAVIYNYARRSDHDQYFFEDPYQILLGNISTPKFNLKNPVMLRKHIHSNMISELLKIVLLESSSAEFSEEDVERLKNEFSIAFPNFIKSYLFNDNGHCLSQPREFTGLENIIQNHIKYFTSKILFTFQKYWPLEANAMISEECINVIILEMISNLNKVVCLLHQRLMWAVNTQNRIADLLKKHGTLQKEEDTLLKRCIKYVEGFKNDNRDNYTLTTLANEGFLPGYGLFDNGVKAFAHQSYIGTSFNKYEFDLSRTNVMAVREYVPGNMIYANSGRFRLVRYRFNEILDETKIIDYKVDYSNKKVILNNSESTATYNSASVLTIKGLPITDNDLHCVSRISDEEINRFQLSVGIIGKIKKSRSGGEVYSVGDKQIEFRIGQRLFLINVGPKEMLDKNIYGYPICSVCGATRSPFATEQEIEHFQKFHLERCNRIPSNFALTAEDNVDGILIKGFDDGAQALNLGEGIIIGAAKTLNMERTDLSLLVYRDDDDSHNLFIYDPMPGGSGLLAQIVEKWNAILTISIEELNNCENNCESSCYSCLKTYHNVSNHSLLNRQMATAVLKNYLGNPKYEIKLEPIEESIAIEYPNKGTNPGEIKLQNLLIEYGFPNFEAQKNISINIASIRITIPDLYYEDKARDIYLAVYLDGLSKNIHGNSNRQAIDRMIRDYLESIGVDVIEIASSDLNDPQALMLSLKRIAAKIKNRDLINKLNS